MLSTKSRLHTSAPGAKKRISMVFSDSPLGILGQTVGRRYIETQVFALRSCVEVNGSSSISSGAENARAHKFLKTRFGTDFLSAGTGSPPSATWKTPAVVRLSLRGLFRMPCLTLYDETSGFSCLSLSGGKERVLAVPNLSRTKVLCGSDGNGS